MIKFAHFTVVSLVCNLFDITPRYTTKTVRVTWCEIAAFRDYKNCEYNVSHVLFMDEGEASYKNNKYVAMVRYLPIRTEKENIVNASTHM